MRISYTQVSTYQRCPQQYKLQYVDRIHVAAGPELHFGAALHEALNFMYDPRRADLPSLEEVVEAFVKAWQAREREVADEARRQSFFEQGVDLMRRHYEKHGRPEEGRHTAATELPFSIPFDGEHSITGRIDRVDSLPENRLEIVDYKTSRRMRPQNEMEKDAQLAIYRMAAEHLYPGAEVTTALLYVFHDYEMRLRTSDEVLTEKREEIRDVIVGIQVQDFDPKVGAHCEWCAYQAYCPLFREPQEPADLQVDIDAVLREYAEVDTAAKQHEKRLAELKQQLHEYFDLTQSERVQAGGLVAERRTSKRLTGFDEERLRAILVPLNLWEGVRPVSASAVRELLKTGQVPREQKRQIEAVAEYAQTRTLRVKPAAGAEEIEEQSE
jgi:putative RecB family exonuclease